MIDPIFLLEAVVNGFLLGGVLALLALGLNLIFGVIDIVWIAYVDLVMICMYAVYFIVQVYGWPIWVGGLASVVGGKLTTYRSLAEAVVDWVLRVLRRASVACPTSESARGPELEVLERQAAAACEQDGVPATAAPRLARLYGRRCGEVIELAARDPRLARCLSEGSPALAAEVVHSVRREFARTVEDVLCRRLMRCA